MTLAQNTDYANAEMLYKRGWYLYTGQGSSKWSKGNIHKVSMQEALRLEREDASKLMLGQ